MLDRKEFPPGDRPDASESYRLVRLRKRANDDGPDAILLRRGSADRAAIAFFDPGGPADWTAAGVELLGSGYRAGRELPVYLCQPGATIEWQRQYYPFKKYRARWDGLKWTVKEV